MINNMEKHIEKELKKLNIDEKDKKDYYQIAKIMYLTGYNEGLAFATHLVDHFSKKDTNVY